MYPNRPTTPSASQTQTSLPSPTSPFSTMPRRHSISPHSKSFYASGVKSKSSTNLSSTLTTDYEPVNLNLPNESSELVNLRYRISSISTESNLLKSEIEKVKKFEKDQTKIQKLENRLNKINQNLSKLISEYNSKGGKFFSNSKVDKKLGDTSSSIERIDGKLVKGSREGVSLKVEDVIKTPNSRSTGSNTTRIESLDFESEWEISTNSVLSNDLEMFPSSKSSNSSRKLASSTVKTSKISDQPLSSESELINRFLREKKFNQAKVNRQTEENLEQILAEKQAKVKELEKKQIELVEREKLRQQVKTSVVETERLIREGQKELEKIERSKERRIQREEEKVELEMKVQMEGDRKDFERKVIKERKDLERKIQIIKEKREYEILLEKERIKNRKEEEDQKRNQVLLEMEMLKVKREEEEIKRKEILTSKRKLLNKLEEEELRINEILLEKESLKNRKEEEELKRREKLIEIEREKNRIEEEELRLKQIEREKVDEAAFKRSEWFKKAVEGVAQNRKGEESVKPQKQSRRIKFDEHTMVDNTPELVTDHSSFSTTDEEEIDEPELGRGSHTPFLRSSTLKKGDDFKPSTKINKASALKPTRTLRPNDGSLSQPQTPYQQGYLRLPKSRSSSFGAFSVPTTPAAPKSFSSFKDPVSLATEVNHSRNVQSNRPFNPRIEPSSTKSWEQSELRSSIPSFTTKPDQLERMRSRRLSNPEPFYKTFSKSSENLSKTPKISNLEPSYVDLSSLLKNQGTGDQAIAFNLAKQEVERAKLRERMEVEKKENEERKRIEKLISDRERKLAEEKDKIFRQAHHIQQKPEHFQLMEQVVSQRVEESKKLKGGVDDLNDIERFRNVSDRKPSVRFAEGSSSNSKRWSLETGMGKTGSDKDKTPRIL